MKPFKWKVFICLGLVFLFISLFLACIEYNVSREKKIFRRCGDFLINCTLYTAGIFMRHGMQKKIQSNSSRVLVSFLTMFCIIIVAAYSGNLVAFLTVTKTYPPFSTLTDVALQDEFMWGTDGGSMWTTLFQTSNISDYQNIWKGILNHNKTKPAVLSLSHDVHRRLVEEGSYLFFFDRDVIAVWAEDNCDLVLLEETFYQITYAVGLPQNSPYADIFSEKMLQIEKSGILQMWKQNWWPKGSVCAEQMQVQAKLISINDLQGAFYVLGIGIVIAMVMLLKERLWRSYKD